jgi:hypothetical protein
VDRLEQRVRDMRDEGADLLGGRRGWIGIGLTTALVAFPMASGVAPLVGRWWHAAGSLPSIAFLGLAFWLMIGAWVGAGLRKEARRGRPARAARPVRARAGHALAQAG